MVTALSLHYQAILFDLDGTLLDTLEDLGNSMNFVLARLGFPTHDPAAYKQFVGEGITMLAHKALPPTKRDDDAVVARCVAAMREEYAARCMDNTDAYPGIHELLADLRQLSVAMAIVSNKPDDMVQALVKRYFPSVAFGAVVGASDAFPRKPHPAGALAIAGALGVPPEKCVFLGDSKTDMETAIAAGMFPVGALWGFRDADELLAHGARVLIRRPGDLLDILKSPNP